MSPTDRECVQRCLDGSPEDYRHLVRRYEGILLAYLTSLMGHWSKAEEVSQEAFVRAYFSLAKLKEPDAFFSWLMGIAVRVAKEQQRLEREQSQLDEPALEVADNSDAAEGRGDYALRHAIAKLPQAYRQMILLRYYGGLSCVQLAKQLSKPIGTVTKTLSRAYAMLRQELNPKGTSPDPGEREVQQ